jgi:hypothetical protein
MAAEQYRFPRAFLQSSTMNAKPNKPDIIGSANGSHIAREPMTAYGITRLCAAQHQRRCVGRLMADFVAELG